MLFSAATMTVGHPIVTHIIIGVSGLDVANGAVISGPKNLPARTDATRRGSQYAKAQSADEAIRPICLQK